MGTTVTSSSAREARAPRPADEQVFHTVVVGAGLSGVAAGVKLRQAGIHDFVILERADRVGGTWRDNTYPGCAVDIPSPVYSFSFHPNPNWRRHFASQPEVLGYIEDTVDRFGLRRAVRLGTELVEAAWSEERRRWLLDTTRGRFVAQHVIFATGPLSEPTIPDIPGLDGFPGPAFHSARWDHGVDLTGKRVAVIGTGCSAVQIVPSIQPVVKQLYVFQRTPAWVVPRFDFPFPGVARWLFHRFPVTLQVLRAITASVMGGLAPLMRRERRARLLNPVGRWMLKRQVPDPELRAKVTPNFTVGCKRLLFSNTYLPALGKENVELIPHALVRVEGSTVVSAGGDEREVDVIVFGSGFELRHPPVAERVVGRGGRRLADIWRQSPEAYLSTTVPSVPNAYVLLGPNILSYRSLIELAEYQLEYVVDAIRTASARGIEVLEVREDACREYNRVVQRSLAASVYNNGGCASFYLDEQGRNFLTSPWPIAKLRKLLSRFDLESYDVVPAPLHVAG